MQLNLEQLKSLCDIAVDVALEAGAYIESQAKNELSIQEKNAGSSRASQIVTEVDMKSQEIILKKLVPLQHKYDLGLLAEELEDDGSRFEKDFFWCIDPMDGTLSFVNSKPGYAVSIALVSREGEAVIGVVYDIYNQNLYHAIKGSGVFKNKESWSLAEGEGRSYKNIDQGGAVMSACWALEEAPACFYKKTKPKKGGGCLWDYAATSCIYNEINGWVSDISGQPLNLNCKESLYMNQKGVLFATSAEIAQEVLNSSE